jgi:hypothetical protein
MSDRTELAIVALVMSAAGLILAAPVLGRSGAPGWADVAMFGAAAAGVGAFGLAGMQTLRAARRSSKEGGGGAP